MAGLVGCGSPRQVGTVGHFAGKLYWP